MNNNKTEIQCLASVKLKDGKLMQFGAIHYMQ